MDQINLKSLFGEMDALKQELQEMKPNLSVLQEYVSKTELYRKRTEALDAATLDFNNVKTEVDTLKKRRLDEFMAGFAGISLKLKEMYQVSF